MDMNKTFFLKKEDAKPNWRLIDAEGKVLGRLATEIALILRGKDKAIYTPHTASGDYVVVVNADKIVMTGDKFKQATYQRYTGWIGNRKEVTAEELMKKHPEQLITLAVKRMLPRNILNRTALKRLKVYPGNEHPHKAQLS